jgi:putative nucleotidyltransferase with HDIG domain
MVKAQGRARNRIRLRVPHVALSLAGITSASLSILCFQTQLTQPGTFWLLLGMIGFAQLMPVDLTRGGVRVVFALPYVAALAVFFGPAAAVGGDLVGQGIGAFLAFRKGQQKEGMMRMVANLSISAISVLCGVLVMGLTQALTVRELVWGMGFIIGYGGCNLLLIAWLEAKLNKSTWMRGELAALGLTARSVALYALLGLAVTSLIAEEMPFLVPLSLIPVWALRTSLIYQGKLYDNYYGTIAALNLMLQRAHPYTHGHLERVAETAEEVAKRLGLGPTRARLVREAAILHDIGKIAVDEEILDKPSKLTKEELDHVRLHATWGAEILSPVREFSPIVPWIRHHHERPDGSGYPDRLSDIEIPIESKIIAVVDAFDAMIGSDEPNGKRTYREPMTVPAALQELERCSGSQFDAEVVRAFRAVVEAEVA